VQALTISGMTLHWVRVCGEREEDVLLLRLGEGDKSTPHSCNIETARIRLKRGENGGTR
jgi:hypothetical protein